MRTFDETGKEFLANYIGKDYAASLSSVSERHAEEALQREYLREVADGARPRNDAPKVAKALDALRELDRFIEKCSADFSEAYIEEHDEELSFSSRTFWETHLL